MPIETSCQGCGRLLRVADEHAGKLARCPHCQTIYNVPLPSPPEFRPASPFAETVPYPGPSPFGPAAPDPKLPDSQTTGVNPYSPPAGGGAHGWPATGYRFKEQHRGAAILVMG